MARTRLLRPEFFNDPDLSRVSIGARLLFQGLLVHMDRNGIMLGQPQVVRSIVFPCDAKMRCSDVARWLDELHKLGRVRKFTYRDTEYVMDPQFGVHQNVYSNDPDVYHVPVETRLKVCRDLEEEKRQLSFDPLNQNQDLNLNQIPDQKNQLQGEVACAPQQLNALFTYDAELEKGQAKLRQRRIDQGLDPDTGAPCA